MNINGSQVFVWYCYKVQIGTDNQMLYPPANFIMTMAVNNAQPELCTAMVGFPDYHVNANQTSYFQTVRRCRPTDAAGNISRWHSHII